MNLSPDPIHFIVTLALSFLTGLEVKTYRMQYHPDSTTYFFGATRTITFIGILGFVLYTIAPESLIVYTSGLICFSILFALFYNHQLQKKKITILLYLVSIVVYTYGPLTVLYPLWMPTLLFVLIVFLLNAKSTISTISLKINARELETFGKMLLLSAVILPLLPDTNVIPYIPLSPFKIWLAVVVISTISYGGYLAQRYIFPSRGIIITGLIGGTYSSTATTVVLAKKAGEYDRKEVITAAILSATAVMYIRLIIVSFAFNTKIAENLISPFLFFAFLGFIAAWAYSRKAKNDSHSTSVQITGDNPLELGTAFIFAALFVVMILLTHAATQYYGGSGLRVFSFIAGFTDIDPFILSLLTGKYSIDHHELLSAIIISAGSNNILKGIYALWFGGWSKTKHSFFWLLGLGLVTIAVGLSAGQLP